MKPLSLLLLLLSAAGLMLACANTALPFPNLTAEAVECRFTLTVDDTPYEIYLRRAPVTEPSDGNFSELTDATLIVEAPSHLDGLSVRLSGNTSYLSAHGMEIPVRREELGGILRLFGCFSTPAEAITEVRTASLTAEQTNVTYDGPYGQFTVCYAADTSMIAVRFFYNGHAYCLTNLHFIQE